MSWNWSGRHAGGGGHLVSQAPPPAPPLVTQRSAAEARYGVHDYAADNDEEQVTLDLELTGGPPWGFRLRGGGAGGPLWVRRVRRRSPAHFAGLAEGDQLVGLNGVSLLGRSHAFAAQLMERQQQQQQQQRRLSVRIVRWQRRALLEDDWLESVQDEDEADLDWASVYGGGADSVAEAAAAAALVEELPVPELQLMELADAGQNHHHQYQQQQHQHQQHSPGPSSFSNGGGFQHHRRLLQQPPQQPQPPQPRQQRRPRYADSAYAGTPGFPTVEERKRLALRVARSLTDPANSGSRGCGMFEGRRARADKFTQEAWGSAPDGGGHLADTAVGGGGGGGSARQPRHAVAGFFGDSSQAQQPKTVAEFVEQQLLLAPKQTHAEYDPARAFSTAEALRTSAGKAGRMFEQRRQRAAKFTVEGVGRARPETCGPEDDSGGGGGVSEL